MFLRSFLLCLAFAIVFPSAVTTAQGILAGFEDLFPDETLATGTNLKVTRNELDQAYIYIKANKAAQGIAIPEAQRKGLEAQLLDKLITTKLILQRATAEEQKSGETFRENQIQLLRDTLGSQEAVDRHIIASGVTKDYYQQQLYEEGIVKVVVAREVKGAYRVSEKAIRDAYQENKIAFTEPESIRIQRIFMARISQRTGNPLSAENLREREALMAELRTRALGGEDFGELAKAYSEDAVTRNRNGEMIVAKGQTKPEFEIPTFRLRPGQISEVMTIGAGLHLIKKLEHRPEKLRPLSEVQDAIRLNLEAKYVEARLPDYLSRIKKEAKVEILVEP